MMAIEHVHIPSAGCSAKQPRAATWIDETCGRVAERLASIAGIKAVALGGSRARGTAREDSDVDLGLYYDPGEPFAIDALDAATCELDDRHTSGLVTPFGGWGTGVNGGGWLLIGAHHVDLLYRDLRRVRAVIERCIRGEIDAVYQLGHPMGFQNQIYAGEIHVCQPLYDPAAVLAPLKQLVAAYPPCMRRALVDKHLFDAQFEIEIAAGPAARGDLVYVNQCLTQAAGFMVLVLYALNERFFLNEKNSFIESGSFALRPHNLHREIERILGQPGDSAVTLTRSVAAMRSIAANLRDFCQEKYPPDPSAGRDIAVL
ncbi:MAG: nucleotidyltransferase domain-containing protein [Deltaproteobacteria bacterium]|nr:nucleotidyltransferase domain-containing protein [Deltaproteobacteria bacterium]